ncbi:hypothetical protein ACQKII_02455 [Lysinibacillus sp. NPDC048646]|uniref:hypothetical protein n=1 Tax=Lysinibacillus sp. NPDC048646 TaxID=3390574 RepID=UPI003D02B54C
MNTAMMQNDNFLYNEQPDVKTFMVYTIKFSSLNIELNNKKEEINEEMFQSFIDYLQRELNVEHADVCNFYV